MIAKTILELNKIFKFLNKEFFENKLIEPIILIQAKSKKHTLGTCSTNPIWQKRESKKNRKYEITLSGKYLNRPIEEIVATLLHESVHLHCSLNEIKDTSNSGVYHNKRFKEEAKKRGLDVAKADTIGWSVTTLKEESKKLIKKIAVDKTAFDYWRNASEFKMFKPIIILNKYECSCGIKLSSTKKLNITCNDCNKKFVKREE